MSTLVSTSLGTELSVAILQRPPQIPAGDGAVRAPLRADLLHVFRQRTLALPIGALDGVLDAEVELREDVASAQPEHQEHLRRPAADAFDLHQMLDQILVR